MGKKIKSIEKLDCLGLNHHLMCITRNVEEALEFAKKHPKGSIRTDWVVESGYNLPFYVYETFEEFLELVPKLQQDTKNGLVLIISNGHAYDDHLRYNLVCSIDRDGMCKAEWSVKQVPLRHMYRYPEDLVSICGHIDERLGNWKICNREANAVNLREIYNRIQELFLGVEEKRLYEKELEISVYRVPCGVQDTDMVFWEL